MSTKAYYITVLNSLVPGEVLPLGEGEKSIAISQAVKSYSKDKPLIVVEEESGNNSFDYILTGTGALLASWSEGFSVIKKVEYPIDATVPEPNYLKDEDWIIYQNPAGKVLRFLEDKPKTTEKIRVTYTTLHTCTFTACTVDVFDEEAVQMLAASFFCDMLATYFAQNQDSMIGADVVDHKSKAQEYAARSRAYRKNYFNHLGIEEGQPTAASINKNQSMDGSWGADKMTHPQRYR